MAKLEDFTRTAGMNGGASLYAKMMRTADIQTDPELASLFPIAEETLAAIVLSMQERGYDRAEPLVIWKGRNVVVDGHTRFRAAGEAGIAEVPVEEKEFETAEDAVLYAYHRQANRRNLTQAEIYTAAVGLKEKAERDGNGRAAEKLAKLLDVSESTIYRARAVDEKAAPEVVEAVKSGDMSINKAYQQVKKRKTPVEQPDNNDYVPPDMEIEPTEVEANEAAAVSEEFEMPESLDITLPDTDDTDTETGREPNESGEETESGILTRIDQAVETLEWFLENHEEEHSGMLLEIIRLLQKIRNRYITGGEPS